MVVKLKPAIKSYLWGGTKLKEQWNKGGAESIAEAWELSFHKDGLSQIDGGEFSGMALSDVATPAHFGENCKEFENFPVLNKLIDAAKPLSVQVHPDDDFALKYENQYGKTEMWHVLSSDGGYIYLGFNRDMTEKLFSSAIADGSICGYLNKIPVSAGQTYFIPAGTVHAIGAGVTLYEVQQNSSLTYRVYDFGRVGKDGNGRELHIEKAKAVANLKKFEVPPQNGGELLGKCRYFSAYRLRGERVVGDFKSYAALTVLNGRVEVGSVTLEKGGTAFVSAGEFAKIRGGGEYILTCTERL